jgi:hypothetical protein
MIYDLTIPEEVAKIQQRLAWLIAKGKRVELKEKRYPKTPRQMRYIHLIMSWYGLETGYTLEEVKQDIVKRDICRGIFERVKNSRVIYRSFADVKDTKEMSIVIDMFRNHASKDLNIYLPEPHEAAKLQSMEEQLSRYGNRQYV